MAAGVVGLLVGVRAVVGRTVGVTPVGTVAVSGSVAMGVMVAGGAVAVTGGGVAVMMTVMTTGDGVAAGVGVGGVPQPAAATRTISTKIKTEVCFLFMGILLED